MEIWVFVIGALELVLWLQISLAMAQLKESLAPRVLQWKSFFDLSGQSSRFPFGHSFRDRLVLLSDLGGRTGHIAHLW